MEMVALLDPFVGMAVLMGLLEGMVAEKELLVDMVVEKG